MCVRVLSIKQLFQKLFYQFLYYENIDDTVLDIRLPFSVVQVVLLPTNFPCIDLFYTLTFL